MKAELDCGGRCSLFLEDSVGEDLTATDLMLRLMPGLAVAAAAVAAAAVAAEEAKVMPRADGKDWMLRDEATSAVMKLRLNMETEETRFAPG